jgi:hypothetical protein
MLPVLGMLELSHGEKQTYASLCWHDKSKNVWNFFAPPLPHTSCTHHVRVTNVLISSIYILPHIQAARTMVRVTNMLMSPKIAPPYPINHTLKGQAVGQVWESLFGGTFYDIQSECRVKTHTQAPLNPSTLHQQLKIR